MQGLQGSDLAYLDVGQGLFWLIEGVHCNGTLEVHSEGSDLKGLQDHVLLGVHGSSTEDIDLVLNRFPDLPLVQRNSVSKALGDVGILHVEAYFSQVPSLGSEFGNHDRGLFPHVVQPQYKLILVQREHSVLEHALAVFTFVSADFLRQFVSKESNEGLIILPLPESLNMTVLFNESNLELEGVIDHPSIAFSNSLIIIRSQPIDIHQQTIIKHCQSLSPIGKHNQLHTLKSTFFSPQMMQPKLHIGQVLALILSSGLQVHSQSRRCPIFLLLTRQPFTSWKNSPFDLRAESTFTKQSNCWVFGGLKVASMLRMLSSLLLMVMMMLLTLLLTDILEQVFPCTTLKWSNLASPSSSMFPLLDMMQMPAILLSDLLMGSPNLLQVVV